METRIELTNELKQNLIGGMADLCEEADYGFNQVAFTKNLDKWAINKAHLYNVFANSSDFNANELAIIKEVEIARELDLYSADDLLDTWAHNVGCPYRLKSTLLRVFGCIENDGTINSQKLSSLDDEQYKQLLEKCTMLTQKWGYNLVGWLDYLYNEYSSGLACAFLLKYLKIQNGTKATKVLNKIFDTFKAFKEGKYNISRSYIKPVRELDPNGDWTGNMCKVLNFNQMQAQLNDMLSPKIDKKKLVISINPLDYITQSRGNSWSSCHAFSPDWDDNYSGCNKGATLTMMVDPSSVIAYILDNDAKGEYWKVPKQNRQSLFINSDNNCFFQNVFYPNNNDYLSRIVRNTIQELLQPNNNWVHSTSLKANIDESEYKGYDDWCKGVDFSYLKDMEMTERPTIVIGRDAYCVDDDSEYVEHNGYVCASHYGQRWCEYCDRWENEDDFIYIDEYGRYFCPDEIDDRLYYCEDIYEYRFYDDCYYDEYRQCWYSDEVAHNYVQNYGDVNEDDLYDSGDFFYCDECDCWYYFINHNCHEHNGNCYCDSCYADLDLDEEGDEE